MPVAALNESERVREVAAVLAKHGLAAGANFHSERAASELRQACEELGTTFVKLAQVLSTRSDILPSIYTNELAKLQDSMPPVDTTLIIDAIESELGASPFDLFASFEIEPMACASIGQVHRVRLLDGRDAAIKIRKPGVRAEVEQDLEILSHFARRGVKLVPELGEYDIVGLIDEFGDMLRAELSYAQEAKNLELFASMFDEESGIDVPEVIYDFSTDRVITLTLLEGEKITEGREFGSDVRQSIVERVTRFVLEPALTSGVFYADPHPGNVIVREDGTVGFVDFGMIGRFGERQRSHLAEILLGLGRRDAQRVANQLIELGPPKRPVDRVGFEARVSRLMERDLTNSFEHARAGATLVQILDIARELHFRLPASVSMFFKAIALVESLIYAIAPDTAINDVIEPIAHDVWRAQLDPKRLAERGMELPRRAERVLSDIERGNLRIWTHVEDAESIVQRLEKIGERVSVAMLVSALAVCAAILIAFSHLQGAKDLAMPIIWIGVILLIGWLARTVWMLMRRAPRLR